MNPRSPSSASPESGPMLFIDGRHVPYEDGVLPADFPSCLHLLRERSGLNWNGFAEAVGADPKQVLRWRRGAEPCGGALHSLLRFARHIPGGVELIMGEDFEMKRQEG